MRGRVLGADVGLLKPQTFMNLSGESVAEALRYLPVEPANWWSSSTRWTSRAASCACA